MQTNMGLNARDIQLRLFIVLQVSIKNSYTFMQKHPRISGALLVFFIIYIFLSYIYNLLVFLSPFLVCTAIFVRIFWSSEQKHNTCVEKKGEEEMVEAKNPPRMLKNGKRKVLYKYPSQNATSRRRNFTRKKLDVYGDLEEKAKDLSAVFCNEFTKKNSQIKGFDFFEKEIDSLDTKLPAKKLIEAPIKQALFSEPSMLDLVTCGGQEKMKENREDEIKAQEDSNKAIELKEDHDQKNLMELKICGMESNKRLESLIARRRARKLLKLHIANGLIDMKSVNPSQIEPLYVTRINPFDSPREFEGFNGIAMPGSAPSTFRSPFDIPYDPFEEKPNLTGDNFDQEFISDQKDMPLEPRKYLEAKEHKLANLRVTRLSGKGNHDMPKQLISKEGSEIEQAPNPSNEGEENTHKEEGNCKIDMADMKGEEVNNVDATNSMPDHANERNLTETFMFSEKQQGPSPQEGVLNFPISSTNATNINDSLYESLSTPVDKNEENNMYFTNGHIRHTPSCSMASDLQVEVSEVGSPTLMVDENHEIIDGDIDKDVSEQDILEANNWRDFATSPIPQQSIDEENDAGDVSSISSRFDMPDDSPTHAATMSSDIQNMFGNVRETGAPQQASHSSDVLQRWKRLMRLMDTHVNRSPREILSEQTEIENENLMDKSQVINDVNNSAATEQDNTQDLRSNEELSASTLTQEVADEVSINSSNSSSSPRSVLPSPQKTTTDQVSSPFQEIHRGVVHQFDMEDVAQETINGEGSLDSMPQNIHPSADDPNVESHNSDLGHSQEQTYPLENYIQESQTSSNMDDGEVCNKEDQKSNNDENSEDKFTPLSRQDASAELHILAETTTSEDMDEKSRELFDNKVPLISLMLESSSEIHTENEEKSQASVRQEASTEPFINAETTHASSANDSEGRHKDLNENEAIFSACMSDGGSDKLSKNHSSDEVNYLQNSESKQVVKDHMEKEQLDKGDISEDTEVTNAKDTLGESDKMNKNEATDQEMHKNNQTMVLSEPPRESDEVSNIVHMDDP